MKKNCQFYSDKDGNFLIATDIVHSPGDMQSRCADKIIYTYKWGILLVAYCLVPQAKMFDSFTV